MIFVEYTFRLQKILSAPIQIESLIDEVVDMAGLLWKLNFLSFSTFATEFKGDLESCF